MSSQLYSTNDFRPPLSGLSHVSFPDDREADNSPEQSTIRSPFHHISSRTGSSPFRPRSPSIAYQTTPPSSSAQRVYRLRQLAHASADVPVHYSHWAPPLTPVDPSKMKEQERRDAEEADRKAADEEWKSVVEEITSAPLTPSCASAREINEAAASEGDSVGKESDSSDFETEVQKACSEVITRIEKGDALTGAWPDQDHVLYSLQNFHEMAGKFGPSTGFVPDVPEWPEQASVADVNLCDTINQVFRTRGTKIMAQVVELSKSLRSMETMCAGQGDYESKNDLTPDSNHTQRSLLLHRRLMGQAEAFENLCTTMYKKLEELGDSVVDGSRNASSHAKDSMAEGVWGLSESASGQRPVDESSGFQCVDAEFDEGHDGASEDNKALV